MTKYSSSEPLLPQTTSPPSRSHKRSLAVLISLFALLTLLTPSPLSNIRSTLFPASHEAVTLQLKSSCAQAEPFLPSTDIHNISSVWGFKDKIIAWHQGAIRIPTQVYDEMGDPGEDRRWDIFGQLHECESLNRLEFLADRC